MLDTNYLGLVFQLTTNRTQNKSNAFQLCCDTAFHKQSLDDVEICKLN